MSEGEAMTEDVEFELLGTVRKTAKSVPTATLFQLVDILLEEIGSRPPP